MVPGWTVTASYFGYAAMLLVGLLCWLVTFFDYIVHGRAEAQLLDQRWLAFTRLLIRNLDVALWGSGLLALGAFVLAALPAEEAEAVAQSHKAYQLRYGAVALCFLGLVFLTRGRMGAFDVDIGALALLAWSCWIVVTGWRAFAAEAAVAGPVGWWLALTVDVLAILGVIALVILIKIDGFRMF